MKIELCGNGGYLVGEYETSNSPLWWQVQGLSYTASGYGSKIPTRHKLKIDNRWYRVYCMIYSNSGTCFIVSKGKQIIVSDLNFKV